MLTVSSLCASYGKKEILHNVSLHLPDGSFTALIGKNGCGKSTLVACLGSSLGFTGEIEVGSLSFKEMSRNERAKKIAVMPQLLSSPPITVTDLAMLGRNPHLGLGKKITDIDRKAVADALKTADLEALAERKLNTLSGGELRRAYLGMILSQSTDIIVLDEATAYLDTANEAKLLDTVKSLGKTALCIMHDLSAAVKYADRIAIMDNGKLICCDSTKAILDSEAIEKNFGLKKYIAENGSETAFFFA